jgi:gamma-D-glutamyl-L-lysine dipeptidyl-peptidase
MGKRPTIRLSLCGAAVAVASITHAGAWTPAAAHTTAPLQRAVVDVSVATIWTAPNMLRPVDTPSATNPVSIPDWLAGMTFADQQWLIGRIQTQALYGTTVTILAQKGDWTKVAVDGQPTQLNAMGYPGWLSTRQLTRNLSLIKIAQTHPVAVVASRTTWLRNPKSLARVMEASFATRLAVLGTDGKQYLVATPTGGRLAVDRSSVAYYSSLRSIPKPTGAQIIATAEHFVGLRYLYGGTSGFGFDCSGLTYTVYRRFGIGMPRDADRQALHGAPIARANLRPGDLLFFAGTGGAGHIHHVALYVGAGKMIHSPDIGQPIAIAPISSLDSEYAGARRYL